MPDPRTPHVYSSMRIAIALALAGCYLDHPIELHRRASTIVFASARDSNDGYSSPQLVRAEATGASPIAITHDLNPNVMPSPSPDGTQIVFVAYHTDGTALHVMSLDSGATRDLDLGMNTAAYPRWSDHAIAFEAPANAVGESLWIVDIDGGEPRRLTKPPEHQMDDAGLAFIDGRRIVFSRYDDRTQDRDLYIASADGSGTKRLTESAKISETQPVTSHDGKLLAYRASYMVESRESIVVLAVEDWSVVTEIPMRSPAHWNIRGIDFAADDKSLVFAADADDVGGTLVNHRGEIFAIDLDGRNLRRLTQNVAWDGDPVTIP